MLRLLRAELPQGEDAVGHRAFLGAVCLQTQHQGAAVQLLEAQRENKGLHEGHVLKEVDRKSQPLNDLHGADEELEKPKPKITCFLILPDCTS